VPAAPEVKDTVALLEEPPATEIEFGLIEQAPAVVPGPAHAAVNWNVVVVFPVFEMVNTCVAAVVALFVTTDPSGVTDTPNVGGGGASRTISPDASPHSKLSPRIFE